MATAALTLPSPAFGAAGEPDPTFGSGGFTTLDDPTGPNEEMFDLLVLPDGRIIAAGASSGVSGFMLTRLSASGVPDPSFGSDGIAIQPDGLMTGDPRGLSAIEFDAQGRIVGAGLGRGAENAFGFARYTADGTPDSSFGGDGVAVVECTASCTARDVAPTLDGGIAAAGELVVSGEGVVVKVDSTGIPDPGFDGEGIKPVGAAGTTGEAANAIETLADGSLIVGGSSSDGAMLAKLTPTGGNDGSFDADGLTFTDLGMAPGGASGSIEDLEILADGRILAVGSSASADSDSQMVVARFTVGGVLDPSFGSGGVFTRNPSPMIDSAYALAIDPGGRIVVVGEAASDGEDVASIWAARLTPDGLPDPSFATNGELIINPASLGAEANGVVLQPDGAAVLAGKADQAGGSNRVLVGRLTGDPVPCRGGQATIVAPAEGGTTTGTDGDDVIAGGPGADEIRAGAGNDVVCGLDANDKAFGEGGNDLLDGAAGKDKLKGGPGKDKLKGGAGKDKLGGGGGKDRLAGGGGKDALAGGGGNDRCNGGPGHDTERSC